MSEKLRNGERLTAGDVGAILPSWDEVSARPDDEEMRITTIKSCAEYVMECIMKNRKKYMGGVVRLNKIDAAVDEKVAQATADLLNGEYERIKFVVVPPGQFKLDFGFGIWYQLE